MSDTHMLLPDGQSATRPVNRSRLRRWFNRHPSSPVPEWRRMVFDRFSGAAELPMLLLSVVMIPVLIIPLVAHVEPGTASTLDAIDYFIWTLFALEYLIKLVLAPRRRHFVTHNLPDLVVVAVPMLRPLRIVRSVRALRLLRLARLSGFAGEGATKAKRSLASRGVSYILIVTSLLILMSSLVVYDLERGAAGASIKSWPDGLWWAVTTVTTVGYGDKVPVTAGGKAVATVLMFTGIALVSVITAAIAAFFVHGLRIASQGDSSPSGDASVTVVLTGLDERLKSMESALAVLADRITSLSTNQAHAGTPEK